MKIVFMGTPDFAKESLEAIYDAGHEILGVVTNPDRPKGRGMKMVASPVKEYAISKNYKYNDIDGIRVNFEDGWALVRASNTGPNLTLRFEATSEARLNEIKDEFMNLVKDLNK